MRGPFFVGVFDLQRLSTRFYGSALWATKTPFWRQQKAKFYSKQIMTATRKQKRHENSIHVPKSIFAREVSPVFVGVLTEDRPNTYTHSDLVLNQIFHFRLPSLDYKHALRLRLRYIAHSFTVLCSQRRSSNL